MRKAGRKESQPRTARERQVSSSSHHPFPPAAVPTTCSCCAYVLCIHRHLPESATAVRNLSGRRKDGMEGENRRYVTSGARRCTRGEIHEICELASVSAWYTTRLGSSSSSSTERKPSMDPLARPVRDRYRSRDSYRTRERPTELPHAEVTKPVPVNRKLTDEDLTTLSRPVLPSWRLRAVRERVRASIKP